MTWFRSGALSVGLAVPCAGSVAPRFRGALVAQRKLRWIFVSLRALSARAARRRRPKGPGRSGGKARIHMFFLLSARQHPGDLCGGVVSLDAGLPALASSECPGLFVGRGHQRRAALVPPTVTMRGDSSGAWITSCWQRVHCGVALLSSTTGLSPLRSYGPVPRRPVRCSGRLREPAGGEVRCRPGCVSCSCSTSIS